MNGNIMFIVPIFGMIFVGWLFYLKFREKQIANQEKVDLIEEGIDPSHLDPKPNSQPSSYKTGLLHIGAALGILFGYIFKLKKTGVNTQISTFMEGPNRIIPNSMQLFFK